MPDNDTKSREAAEAILAAASQLKDSEITEDLRNALNACADLDAEQKNEVRRLLAKGLPALDSPGGAGIAGVWLGGAVENGLNPELTYEGVLNAMLKWCGRIRTVSPNSDQEDEAPEPAIVTATEY